MVKGTTSAGFEFEYDETRLDDMRIVDLIAEADSPSASAFSRFRISSVLVEMLLGPELKSALYNFIGASYGGRVPQLELENALREIMAAAGKDAEKN